MNKEIRKQTKTELLKLFIFYYTVHPAFYFISLIIALGFMSLTGVLKIIIILAPPIIALFTLIFYYLAARAQQAIDKGNDNSETIAAEINSISFKGLVLLAAGCSGGPLLTVLIGYRQNLFLSFEQSLFFFFIGLIQALIAGAVFYYHVKIRLYVFLYNSDLRVNFRPLTLFQKMVIPILSGIMILLIFAAVGIYRISYTQTYEMYSSNISARVQKNTVFIGSLFEKTAVQLRAFAKTSEISNMNLREISEFLKMIHEERGGDIEMYFAANLQGDAPNSLGETRNIIDREYFKRVTGVGVEVYSDPVLNKQTGRMIMVAAVPVKNSAGRTVGLVGATILLDRVEGLLTDDRIIDSGRFMIISSDGKVFFHPDRTNIGKIIGKDVKDDGKNIKNISRILTESENRFFSYTYGGKEVFSYKISIPLVRQMLVFTMDRDDFVEKLRYILLELLAALIGLGLMLYLMIRYIAKRFSLPIQNTIGVLERLAAGDLTAESTDFLADEFGEMIRNFKQFQRKLRSTITTALKAAVQLSGSAHELAITSSNMSDSAQTQAASVEEASASLEEVSGSIELININAQEQAKLAKTTYDAMEQLRRDNETVAGYAEKALEAARGTTEQAGNGQQLMQNTIEGMNNIDESTKKIADTVRLISDISDQVNLLALNASIEAARAGEHGRGFAVVAEEISKLADQTASSAKGITDFVYAGLREVEKGRSYVDETGRAFNMIIEYIAQTEELVRKITESAARQAESSREVLESTKKVNEMSDSISVSTNEQMMTNQEMSKTVEQINQNTQAAAAAAEEIASSADEISAQAEILSARMEFFKV